MAERDVDKLVAELKAWNDDLKDLRETMNLMWEAWTPPPPEKKRPVDPNVRDPENPFVSRVRVPMGHHHVETIVPRVLGFEQRMNYKALDNTDDVPIAAMMGGLTTWQMARMGYELEARNYVRQGCVLGYTAAMVGWIREEMEVDAVEQEFVHDPMLFTTFQLEKPAKETIIVRNDPFFETIDVAGGDFVWPKRAKSIDQAQAVWHRRWVTKRYLQELAAPDGPYKNVDKIEGDARGRFQAAQRERDYGDGDARPTSPEPDEGDELVELWSRWEDDYLCVIANPFEGPVKIREEESPFDHNLKPFVDWAPVPNPFRIPGVGTIQTIYDQNEDLNTLRRQVRDALTYLLNPAWKKIGGVPGGQMSLFPGKVVDLEGDMDDIAPLTNPVVDFGAAYQMEQEIKRDMRDTTGAHDVLAGGSSETAQTATEIATLSAEGNKRLAEMIKVYEQRTMVRFGHLLAEMNTQYVTDAVAADFSDDPAAAEAWQQLQAASASTSEGRDRSGGEPADPKRGLVQVTPDMILAKGRLEPVPQVGQDKQLSDIQKRSDAAQLMQALAPLLVQPAVAMMVNWQELVTYVAEQYGMTKADRATLLQVPQEQFAALTAEQLLGQLGAGNGTSGPSGPSGEPLPGGGVVGSEGAAGPAGPTL